MVAYEERAEGVRPAKQLRRDLKCGEANLSVVPSQFTDQKRHDEWDARRLGPESRYLSGHVAIKLRQNYDQNGPSFLINHDIFSWLTCSFLVIMCISIFLGNHDLCITCRTSSAFSSRPRREQGCQKSSGFRQSSRDFFSGPLRRRRRLWPWR